MRLTNLYAQIRAVGVNYNQTVKAIHTNFNDRRAVALLSRLEKHTQELTVLFGQVIRLTEEFNRRWSVE
ncbi:MULTISPECIES: plasmid mobilization protein [Alistipes]|uniref:plasmid mobilization protein n=1 Tax=Alistipes TaxID=239759 RepID=UPI001C9C5CC2